MKACFLAGSVEVSPSKIIGALSNSNISSDTIGVYQTTCILSFADGVASAEERSGTVTPTSVQDTAQASSPTGIYAFGGKLSAADGSSFTKDTYEFKYGKDSSSLNAAARSTATTAHSDSSERFEALACRGV